MQACVASVTAPPLNEQLILSVLFGQDVRQSLDGRPDAPVSFVP